MQNRSFARLAAMAAGLALSVPAIAAAAPLKGFADLHNHMFMEYAFGGGWLHGNAVGPEEIALKACDVDIDLFGLFEDHARTWIPFINGKIGAIAGGQGDTGGHSGRRDGYPTYEGWPKWDTIAHQQVWEGWLKSAHEQGLSLIVVSAVNFEPLCRLMPKENRKYECDDMKAVDRQLDAAEAFARTHPWAEIVRSPADARRAIGAGKLAIVLSFEVTNTFGAEDWRAALDRYQARGLRTFQIAHQMDNRFTGVATHNPTFKFFELLRDLGNVRSWKDLRPSKIGMQTDERGFNLRGLSDEGKQLVTEMMRRGFLVDLAHTSERAVRDVAAISERFGDYPVYLSHGHFRNMMSDGRFDRWEKASDDWVLELVRKTGGMFGLRTGPERTKRWEKGATANDCQGSTKSYAQTYQYGAIEKGVRVGFGSDLNGFIQQTRPRFGDAEATCGAERDEVERARQQQAQRNPLGRRFDRSGLGRVDQLADILAELRNFGVDTSTLESSAENFVQMWERSERLAAEARKKGL